MNMKTIRDIWNRRSLIMVFAINDLKVRYKNSVLGFFWSFLEPLLMLGVLYFAFTTFLKNAIPNYPLYLLLGLIMWGMYSRSTGMGLSSLLGKAALVSKTSFPREIPIISANITSFLMMTFEFVVFFVFLAIFKFVPPVTMILLPPIMIILFIYCLGISFALSVLNVYFRDLQSIWGVLLQATFFISPIVFTLSVFPPSLVPILSLNPLVVIMNMAHDTTLYGKVPSVELFLQALGSAFLALSVGYAIFKTLNKRIVEKF